MLVEGNAWFQSSFPTYFLDNILLYDDSIDSLVFSLNKLSFISMCGDL